MKESIFSLSSRYEAKGSAFRLSRMAVLLLITLPSSAATLQGKVADPEGASVRGARVFIRADRSGGITPEHQILVLTTDQNGDYQANLPKGFYDVCVLADAFTPNCRKVRIEAKRTKLKEARLSVDPLVSDTIADRFSK